MTDSRRSTPPPRLTAEQAASAYDDPLPTQVERATGKALAEEARRIAHHAAQLCDQLDRFIRTEVGPITTRIELNEQTIAAFRRRIETLEATVAKLAPELAEPHTGE